MTHRHKSVRSRGPFGCAGSVSYVDTCSCGAERRHCSCTQCKQQGTSDSGWYMPTCKQCGQNHPVDRACQAVQHTA